ncbi:MAG: glycosyltransferase family 2 protein [Deltaproteobacteria bacterium]|jgi:glycosyltransferase involved in cell wall biosynthesis|nr:glycosyltransferase family 2 protein [Deltaproteobacteria bacterium]
MTQSDKSVSILMGTYNGESYLPDQLNSFHEQSYDNWTLTASDDGSKDNTIEILKKYQHDWGEDKLKIIDGPREGFCRNFMHLTIEDNGESDYYAWSDQDDIWLPHKLSRIIELISPIGEEEALLYCGRTQLMNQYGVDTTLSPLRTSPPPSFSNAIIQSIAGANTMVFNNKARDLIVKGYPLKPISHDWWAYQIVTGAGGLVIYDPVPTIRYRQHSQNIIGSNNGLLAFAGRVKKAWQRNFRQMNDRNFQALYALEDYLTSINKETLDTLVSLRKRTSLWNLHRQIKKYNIYRRSFVQQLALYIGFLAQRI